MSSKLSLLMRRQMLQAKNLLIKRWTHLQIIFLKRALILIKKLVLSKKSKNRKNLRKLIKMIVIELRHRHQKSPKIKINNFQFYSIKLII